MIILTIAIDYILHRLQWASVGLYFGYIGSALVVLSFLYSLRKRKIITDGSPKKLLILHEYLAWLGSVLLLVHAGIHFNAILPWLAIIMLLINVASGLVGKYLLKKSTETLKVRKSALIESGIDEVEAEKKLFWDSITVDLMNNWRTVHIPISLLFGILAILHIVTILMY
jgi:hypothetical protein